MCCGAAGYVGCMKTGQIFTDPRLRWYEPQHVLLGSKSYFAHAWGTAYVLSGRTAAFLATLPPDALRFFMNEGAPTSSFLQYPQPRSRGSVCGTSVSRTLLLIPVHGCACVAWCCGTLCDSVVAIKHCPCFASASSIWQPHPNLMSGSHESGCTGSHANAHRATAQNYRSAVAICDGAICRCHGRQLDVGLQRHALRRPTALRRSLLANLGSGVRHTPLRGAVRAAREPAGAGSRPRVFRRPRCGAALAAGLALCGELTPSVMAELQSQTNNTASMN